MRFKIIYPNQTLIFESNLTGLVGNGKEYLSQKDGKLIYDKVNKLEANQVSLQLSTNTSTLIPALKILSLPYYSYFDQREVVTL